MTSGFSHPSGIVFDGTNIWVTDPGDNKVKKLGSTGSILLSVTVGSLPRYPAFDGTNIWVPNFGSNSVSVVRVKDSHGDPLATPFVLATLTGNGLASPIAIAFDGERILVTNHNGHSVSLWKAADLTPIGTFSVDIQPLQTFPQGVCSDGVNFWIILSGKLARY